MWKIELLLVVFMWRHGGHVGSQEVEKQNHLEDISPCLRRDYSVSNIVLWRVKSVINVFSDQDKHYSCGKEERRAVSSFLPLNPLISINILIDQGHSTTLSSLIHWKHYRIIGNSWQYLPLRRDIFLKTVVGCPW